MYINYNSAGGIDFFGFVVPGTLRDSMVIQERPAGDTLGESARLCSQTRLTLTVLLKVFQRLGHLPRLQDVPFAVVTHVRSSLRLTRRRRSTSLPRTLYRHHEQIRTHLQVKTWGTEARMQRSWLCTRPPR